MVNGFCELVGIRCLGVGSVDRSVLVGLCGEMQWVKGSTMKRNTNQRDEMQKSKSHKAVEAIREMIASHGWSEGTKLPSQRDLSLALGFSRSTIREAIATMEAGGQLIIEPSRGVFLSRRDQIKMVQSPKAESLPKAQWLGLAGRETQMYQFRLMVEPSVAGLVAQNATDVQLRDLQIMVESMAKAMQEGKLEQFSGLDFNFHGQMLEAANNCFFNLSISPFLDLFHESQKLPFRASEDLGETLVEHERIMDALWRRSPEDASIAMRQHVEGVAARAGVVIPGNSR